MGWLTLAIAGHGGLLGPRRFTSLAEAPVARAAGHRQREPGPASSERRALLQAGLLAVAAVAVSSLAVPMRLLGLERPTVTRSPTSSAGPGTSEPPPSGLAVAKVADVDRLGSVAFTVRSRPRRGAAAGGLWRSSSGSATARTSRSTRCAPTPGAPWRSAPDDAPCCRATAPLFDPEQTAAVLPDPPVGPGLSCRSPSTARVGRSSPASEAPAPGRSQVPQARCVSPGRRPSSRGVPTSFRLQPRDNDRGGSGTGRRRRSWPVRPGPIAGGHSSALSRPRRP